MIAIATARTAALEGHPPIPLWVMLDLTVVASSVLASSMARSGTRRWVHVVAFSLLLGTFVYATVDFEYPRTPGFIRADKMLV